MPLSLLFKLAPYLVAIGLLVGVFFYGVNVGKTKMEVKYKQEIIDAGKEDIAIENRQANIIASRGLYNLSERLHNGSF